MSVTDVLPTVLDGLGRSVPTGLDGRSLLATSGERGTYFESYSGYLQYGWSPLAGWTDGNVKVLQGTDPELYDLSTDPGERTNLVAERPDDLGRARSVLGELAARPRLAIAGAIDESLAADVQALGYAGAAGSPDVLPDPLDETGLPAPRKRMEELERFYAAVLRYNKGKRVQAIEELRAIVTENPGNATALNVLATYLLAERKPAEALAVLERIPAHAQERVTVQDLFGHCFEQLGSAGRCAPPLRTRARPEARRSAPGRGLRAAPPGAVAQGRPTPIRSVVDRRRRDPQEGGRAVRDRAQRAR